MNSNQLLPFFKLVPPTLRNSAVIAGGAVADPMLATDIDIFILDVPNVLADQAQADVKAYLNSLNIDADYHDLHPEEWTEKSEYPPSSFQLLATIDVGRKIQILTRAETQVMDVLNNFDISTCQHAISANDVLFTGVKSSGPTEPLELVNSNDKTADRLEKFTKRIHLRRVLEGLVDPLPTPPPTPVDDEVLF